MQYRFQLNIQAALFIIHDYISQIKCSSPAAESTANQHKVYHRQKIQSCEMEAMLSLQLVQTSAVILTLFSITALRTPFFYFSDASKLDFTVSFEQWQSLGLCAKVPIMTVSFFSVDVYRYMNIKSVSCWHKSICNQYKVHSDYNDCSNSLFSVSSSVFAKACSKIALYRSNSVQNL